MLVLPVASAFVGEVGVKFLRFGLIFRTRNEVVLFQFGRKAADFGLRSMFLAATLADKTLHLSLVPSLGS